MELARYSGQPAEWFSELFARHAFGRYCSDWTLDLEAARRLERDRFVAYLEANAETSLLAIDEGRVRGAIGLRASPWDTDVWGFPCATVEHLYLSSDGTADERRDIAERLVGEGDRWCEREGIRFAFARCDAQDLHVLHALEAHGFRYIETTVANCRDLRRQPAPPTVNGTIREADPGEADRLVDIVRGAFGTHRFYADGGFPAERVDAMYQRWVRDDLRDPAWTTIVLEEEGRVNAFMTYGVDDLSEYLGLRFAKWRMFAVDGKALGRGHGAKLLDGAMDYVKDDLDIVDSGLSLRNVRSLNIHNQLGFRAVAFSTTLHKWYEAAQSAAALPET
jgi:GNAT superfamily N-acetyltransferase